MTAPVEPTTASPDVADVHDAVRARYADAARAASGVDGATSEALESCCADDGRIVFGSLLYAADERAELPDAAVLASLGCGNPTAVAELQMGETVLDLGSGGGIDVLLSARRVGPTGLAIGVDMTDEMLDLAQANAAEAGIDNVEFRKGTIEALPLDDESVDVVISNCVVNLAADKGAVLAEIARVLRPGGRIGISDVVAEDRLTAGERAERGSYVGCIAGALSMSEFRDGLAAVGLTDVDLVPTHSVADGLHSTIIRARKPQGWVRPDPVLVRSVLPSPSVTRELAMVNPDACGCGSGACC